MLSPAASLFYFFISSSLSLSSLVALLKCRTVEP
jgi:hypothetical protein